jgi:peptidoglycan/LPS O-acetylase OafA/YrhL
LEKPLTSFPGSNPETSAGANAHSKFYIPSLDGLRTVAFLIVFLSHAKVVEIFPGGFGVTIFFFLSGYLITTILRREQLHKVPQAAIALLISLGLAYTIYQFIELPLGQLRKKFSRA